MKHKKRKPLDVRPTIPVQWTKDNPDGKERFEKACKREGGAPVTVARTLCDAWADLILGKEESDIEKAARSVAAKKKK